MADATLKFKVDGLKETTKQVQEVEKSFSDLRKEYQALKNTSFAGKSVEEIAAIKNQMAGLRADMADFKSLEDSLDKGNAFKNIAGSIGVVSGAMAGLTGAYSLFGAENEQMNALQQKTIALMGIAQAAQQVQDSFDQNVYLNKIKRIVAHRSALMTEALTINTVSTASKTAAFFQTLWNKTIAANPIMAIVIAVAALAAGIAYLVIKQKESSKSAQEMAKGMEEYKSAVKSTVEEGAKNLETLSSLQEGTKEYKDELLKLSVTYADYLDDTQEAALKNASLSDAIKIVNEAIVLQAQVMGNRAAITKYYEEIGNLTIAQQDLEDAAKNTAIEFALSNNMTDKASETLYNNAIATVKNTKEYKNLETQKQKNITSIITLTKVTNDLLIGKKGESKATIESINADIKNAKSKEDLAKASIRVKNELIAEGKAQKDATKLIDLQTIAIEKNIKGKEDAKKRQDEIDKKKLASDLRAKQSEIDLAKSNRTILEQDLIGLKKINKLGQASLDRNIDEDRKKQDVEIKKMLSKYPNLSTPDERYARVELGIREADEVEQRIADNIKSTKALTLAKKELEAAISETTKPTALSKLEDLQIENQDILAQSIGTTTEAQKTYNNELETYKTKLIDAQSKEKEGTEQHSLLGIEINNVIKKQTDVNQAIIDSTNVTEEKNKALAEQIRLQKELTKSYEDQLRNLEFGNFMEMGGNIDLQLFPENFYKENSDKILKLKDELANNLKLTEEDKQKILAELIDLYNQQYDIIKQAEATKNQLAKDLVNETASSIYNLSMAWAQKEYDDKLEMLNKFYTAQNKQIAEQYDTQAAIYDDQVKNGLISQERANFLKGELDKQEKSAQIKRDNEQEHKQKHLALGKAKYERDLALARITIETAVAIAKTIAEYAGMPLLWGPIVALQSGMFAVQAATIKATPLPKAERGMLVGNRHGAMGGIPIEAENGEFIVNRTAMSNPSNAAMVQIINAQGNNSSVMEGLVTSIVRQIISIPVVVSEKDISSSQRRVSVIDKRTSIL